MDVAVARAAMCRVMVEMRCRQHDRGSVDRHRSARGGVGRLRLRPLRQIWPDSSHQLLSSRWGTGCAAIGRVMGFVAPWVRTKQVQALIYRLGRVATKAADNKMAKGIRWRS